MTGVPNGHSTWNEITGQKSDSVVPGMSQELCHLQLQTWTDRQQLLPVQSLYLISEVIKPSSMPQITYTQ